MSFITPNLVSDETANAEAALAGIADQIDDWQPSEGGLITPVCESVGISIATAVTAFLAAYLQAYVGFGQNIIGITPTPATTATCLSTWTVSPNALTVIPAGTEVDGTLLDGTTSTFQVNVDATVPADATTVPGVMLVALETGPDQNGFTNPASCPLVGVLNVTITAPATNGEDAQDPQDYADEVADRAQRLHAIPMTPQDWAVFFLDVPGVDRCVVLNRYDPSNPTVDTPGALTFVGVDINGAALTQSVKAAAATYFQSFDTPLNVTWFFADPNVVDLTVDISVTAPAGVDPTADVQAAITGLLNPAGWDADQDQPGGWATDRRSEITIFDIAAAVNTLTDVTQITAVTINGGTAAVSLPAPVSLPALTAAATVTVTNE